jgi:serine/threonine protein kinase
MNPMFDSSRSIPDLVVMSSAENTWGIPFDMLEIGEKIGAGGSGQVYRGTYQNRPVALKELYSVMVEDATGEFKKEATILAKLNHPHIVRYIKYIM